MASSKVEGRASKKKKASVELAFFYAYGLKRLSYLLAT
ncbi:hypothetical protein CAter282_4449 [Collimonas arenae]|uniref:Uncharacterized protein n=1 Tax=Collimonas arenae TaxID=279058 RepID=A0A127PWK9_9BURK|nr:hypothetical protein CAter10_4833 [Collimonas arenae]AMP12108.1 hypothetical protein CAter282_4449 [Collimonas arenae]